MTLETTTAASSMGSANRQEAQPVLADAVEQMSTAPRSARVTSSTATA